MSASDWTEERVALLRTLWMQGLSAAAIGKRMGVTASTIIGKKTRLGLPARAMAKSHRTGKERVATPHARIKKLPKLKPEKQTPPPPSRAPVHTEGDGRPRFIDRLPNQCAMFCVGEEMSQGFVCGAPVSRGVLCAECHKLSYVPAPPLKPRRAA